MDKTVYKITKVKDIYGNDKKSLSAQNRVGRTGKILVLANDTSMVFLYEPESREIIGKDMMVTSRVLHHKKMDNPKWIIVTTENSVYELEEA